MRDNRKIITKAVYGRTAQVYRKVVRISYDQGDVLGCTICKATVLRVCIESDDDQSKIVRAEVKFEMHIWYRQNRDSYVAKMSIEFADSIVILKRGTESFSDEKAFVLIKEKPKCLETINITNAEKNKIAVQIEYTLEAEIIGETILNVKVFET